MEKIFSRIDETKLLHIIFRKEDFLKGRLDLIESNNFIQCSALNMDEGKTFQPHRHIWKKGRKKTIAQESWVVIQGKVKCFFYDTDNNIICEKVLNSGDASFTLDGGHNYLILMRAQTRAVSFFLSFTVLLRNRPS